MANANVSTRDTQLEKQRLGFIAITFSNMDNTSEPKIQSGSVVEVAGTLYSFSSEESNTDWAGIGNGTQAYLMLDPAGDSSSVSAKWTDNAPAWSEAKFGWYGDGVAEDADNRYILRCYKDASGNYTEKYKYEQDYGNRYISGDNTFDGTIYDKNGEEVLSLRTKNVSGSVVFSGAATPIITIDTGETIKGVAFISVWLDGYENHSDYSVITEVSTSGVNLTIKVGSTVDGTYEAFATIFY